MDRGEPVGISVDGSEHVVQPEEVTVVRRAAGDYVVQEGGGYVAALDPAISEPLRREGLARELVSRVQRMRKEAGLLVSDRIRLLVVGDPEVESAAREHRDWIAAEVLARRLAIGAAEAAGAGLSPGLAASGAGDALTAAFATLHYAAQTFDLDGRTVRVTLTKDQT
jgi:isoleucyl-tRNA synthetase